MSTTITGGVVGVIGAGTMGAGIATLACSSGFDCVLSDTDQSALSRAVDRVDNDIARMVLRGKLSKAEGRGARERLVTVQRIGPELSEAVLVVEAVPESIDLKARILAAASQVAPTATIASNTSSLTIESLARRLEEPQRVVGMHFFNPPTAMRLVELVVGPRSSVAHASRGRRIAEAMGKTVVTVQDGPGFLVNRCARPFYLEALRIVRTGTAGLVDVDAACVAAGFPMGPFRLMDAIGIDISLAVTGAMYEQSGGEPRWKPDPMQERLVAEHKLGKKTGEGFYSYGCESAAASSPVGSPAVKQVLVERIVAQLVNEAWFALDAEIASAAVIDTAMTVGLRYPRGPLAWGDALGLDRVVSVLDELSTLSQDPAYRVAAGLRLAATANPQPKPTRAHNRRRDARP